MTKSGAEAAIKEAMNRVFWPGEQQPVYDALVLALRELEEIQVIEVCIQEAKRC